MEARIKKLGLNSALVVAAAELRNGQIVDFEGGDRAPVSVVPDRSNYEIRTCGRTVPVDGWDKSAEETIAVAYHAWITPKPQQTENR